MTNQGKLILGLLGAAAAGVAIGMLIAPDKGSELRKKISDTACDLASKATDMIASGKNKLEDVASTAVKQAEGLYNDVTKRGERVKDAVS